MMAVGFILLGDATHLESCHWLLGIILQGIAHPIEVDPRACIPHLKFGLDIRFVFLCLHLKDVHICIHQSRIVGSIEDAGTRRFLMQLNVATNAESWQIAAIEWFGIGITTYPFCPMPSCIGGRSREQAGFKPRCGFAHLILAIHHLYGPGISGSRLKCLTFVSDTYRSGLGDNAGVPYLLAFLILYYYLIVFLISPLFIRRHHPTELRSGVIDAYRTGKVFHLQVIDSCFG